MKAISLLAIATLIFVSFGIAGCDMNEGPVEKAGKKVDNAVEETGEAMEEAGDKMHDKIYE
ncbi:MAG: putative small secreted protein [Cycloclasticus sp.]|jgi:predicted small secreted protein